MVEESCTEMERFRAFYGLKVREKIKKILNLRDFGRGSLYGAGKIQNLFRSETERKRF